MYVVIAYDIPDDKRRTRVSKLLIKYGERKQFSLFEARIEPDDFRKLKIQLYKLLISGEDQIRIYTLCNRCLDQVDSWGKTKVPEDPYYYLA